MAESPAVVQSAERKLNSIAGKEREKRRRRSSSLMYHEPPESLEQQSDQAVLPNLNAQWVNAKGELELLFYDADRTSDSHLLQQ